MDKILVVLADDRAAVRSSLRLLLEEEPAFEVIDETANAPGLLQIQAQNPAELILIDWELPGLPLPELLHLIDKQRFHKDQKLWIVAMSSNPASRQEALDAGVNAFIDKSQAPNQVLGTLRNLSSRVPDTSLGQLPG